MNNMNIVRAYKTELDPNNKQATQFEGACGMARFVFNWALDYWIKEYERGEKRTGWMKLSNKLTQLKQTEYSWMYEYDNWVRVYALRQCDDAYQNFFRRVKNGEKPGFPKFKNRYKSKKAFTINGLAVKVSPNKIRLGRFGWIRLKENNYIPIEPEKICFATISKDADSWFVSVTVEETIEVPNTGKQVIGIDLGLNALAVTSDGEYYDNLKPLYAAEKKLKRLDRELSRKKRGSENYKKAKLDRAKGYQKVKSIRKHTLNEITTELAKKRAVIVIEDLKVKNMVKNHTLARAISDASWSEFRRMLEYKCTWYGSELYVIDRWFPSTKTCSNCGAIQDMPLNKRTYKCDCGLEMDRDLNAAINIRKYYTVKCTEINACGENVSPQSIEAGSLKQEVGSNA